jgi:hypothetical protein
VTIEAGRVVVTGGEVARDEPIESIEVTEALGTAPRLIRFADGAFCEVQDREALARLRRPASVRAACHDGSRRTCSSPRRSS